MDQTDRSIEQEWAAALTYEACLDVAVFAIVMARCLRERRPCPNETLQQLLQEWSLVANRLVSDQAPAFEYARLRRALKGHGLV